MNATVLYYTSNREHPEFEARVRKTILDNCGGLPIISVSHRPIDFGRNICVGDVGVSGFNMFRQVLMGCEAADTEFIISAEADCIYPKSYFEFKPERNDVCYRNSNLYVMPDARDYFFYKEEGATHAQVVGREFYIETLKKLFDGAPQWNTEEKNFPKERLGQEDVFTEVKHFRCDPVIQIKTHRGMRYYTRSDRTPIPSLPLWGEGKKLRAYYLHGR